MDENKGPLADINAIGVEIECSLVGSVLINNDAYYRATKHCSADDFCDPFYAEIWRMFDRRIPAGKAVDAKLIAGEIASLVKRKDIKLEGDKGEIITTQAFLAKIAFEATGILLAEDYAIGIRDRKARRDVLGAIEYTKATISADTMEIDGEKKALTALGLIDEQMGALSEIRESLTSASDAAMANKIQSAINTASLSHKERAPIGWPWFMPEIDELIDGPLEPGNLYGLMGGSGDGKTSFCLQQMWHLATLKEPAPALFLTEQSETQCIWQLFAQTSRIPHGVVKHGKLTDDQFDQLVLFGQDLAKKPIDIQSWSDEPMHKVSTRVRAFVKRHGPGLIVIDHAKNVTPANPRDILAAQVYSSGMQFKKLLADTGCAGILLHQRNAKFLDRRNMWPVRADAYGGENGVQPSDSFFAVYQPAIWMEERAKIEENKTRAAEFRDEALASDGVAYLVGLKSRFGKRGRQRKVQFTGEYTRFSSKKMDDYDDLLEF